MQRQPGFESKIFSVAAQSALRQVSRIVLRNYLETIGFEYKEAFETRLKEIL